MKDHIPIILSLRGVAALAVVLYHFVCTTTGFIDHEVVLGLFHFGAKGVPLFFVISGMVIPLHMIHTNYKYRHFGVFALRRILRVEPAYMVALIVGVAYCYLRSAVLGKSADSFLPTGFDAVLHLGYLVPFFEGARWVNPVFWTLAIEFQYYLFLAALFPCLVSGNRWVRNLSIILGLGLSFIPVPGGMLLPWLPLFFVGITYAFFRSGRMKVGEFILWFAVSLVLVGVNDWQNALVGFVTVMLVHFLPHLNPRMTAWLGDMSYSLYLIHGVTGAVVINLLSHHVSAGYSKLLVIIGGLAVAFVAARLMYIFIERPSHAMARNVGRLRSASREPSIADLVDTPRGLPPAD